MARPIQNAILIAGPTASGKSALALDLARETGGVIVNADSMQVYDVLRVLTARPDEQALAAVPHLLYGHVHPSIAYSVAAWLADVEGLANVGAFEERPAIFVGGTGLYFTALTQGLSDIPHIPADIRAAWRQRLAQEGAEALHRKLAEKDSTMALRLKPADGQRIVRALEVLEGTGRSIADWQSRRTDPLVGSGSARKLVLEPDREVLAASIGGRFDAMMNEGALGEVKAVTALSLDPALPAMKAIGLRELTDLVAGLCSLDEATERAKAATRQYAKRQMTWFRGQLGADWERISQ